MARGGKAGGVAERTVVQAKRPPAPRHGRGKGFLAARYPLRQGDRCIVGGMDDRSEHQVFHPVAPAALQSDAGAALARRMFADRHALRFGNPAGPDRLEDQQCGHQFGHRRRPHPLPGIFCEKDAERRIVDQQCLSGRGCRGAGRSACIGRRRGRQDQACWQEEQQERTHCHPERSEAAPPLYGKFAGRVACDRQRFGTPAGFAG